MILNALALGSVVLIPILAESGALDTMPLLKLPFKPFMMIWPLGPPLLLMALFGLLGRSRRQTKVTARVIAALLFYVPVQLMMIGYAFSGMWVVEGTDATISVVSLVCGAPLAWFGFKSDEATDRSAQDQA